MRQKEHTSGSENRSAPGPLEESIANLRFQLLNLLAERGLGDAALVRGSTESASASHCHKIAQLVHLDRFFLCYA
jgi:hypothetical protein